MNPREIIEKLEKVDDLEYNPATPNPPNQMQLIRKRVKLRETWDGVVKQCERDAPEQSAELGRLWDVYYEGMMRKGRCWAQASEKLKNFDWG